MFSNKRQSQGFTVLTRSTRVKSHSKSKVNRVRGGILAEFLILLPILLLICMGCIQWALIYQAKSTMNHAAFMATRAGTVESARPDAIRSAFIRSMTPLYSPEKDRVSQLGVDPDAIRRATEDLAPYIRLRILNPTREAFDDFGIDKNGTRVIPNARLHMQSNATGGSSGVSRQDANLLKVEMMVGQRLRVPFINWVITKMGHKLTSDPLKKQMFEQGRLPIVITATARMQSDPELSAAVQTKEQVENGLTTTDRIPGAVASAPGDRPWISAPTGGSYDGYYANLDFGPKGLNYGDANSGGNTSGGGNTGGNGDGTGDNGDGTGGGDGDGSFWDGTEPECVTEWSDPAYNQPNSSIFGLEVPGTGAIKSAYEVVKDFTVGVVEGIVGQVTGIIDFVKTLLTDWEVVKEMYNKIKEDPGKFFKELGQALVGDVRKIFECGPKDIGQVIGENLDPTRFVGALSRVLRIDGLLARYADDIRRLEGDNDINLPCRGRGASFTAGTPIFTANNGMAPIESLKVGDVVYARDESDFSDYPQRITHLHNRTAPGYYLIKTDGGDVQVTSEHPFWVQGSGWMKAEHVEVDDAIATADGDVYVTATDYIEGDVPVFNITVEYTPNYFAGDMKLWVHNQSATGPCNLPTHQSPSGYRLGHSDGGPGGWAEINRPDTDAYRYQEQITGAPRGIEYDVNGVKFDGFDASTGNLLDAKLWNSPNNPLSPGKDEFIRTIFTDKMLKEARDQLAAAAGSPIQWVISDPVIADEVMKIFAANNINISVTIVAVAPGP